MNKNLTIKNGLQTLALTALLSTSAAWAAATPSNSSTSSASGIVSTLKDHLTVSALSIFDGFAVNDASLMQPDQYGTPSDKIMLENRVSLGYKITPRLVVSVNQPFNLTPTRENVSSNGMQLNGQVLDTFLRLNQGVILERGNFSLGGGLRAYAPTTALSRDTNKFITGLRADQYVGIKIDNSRWNFSSTTFVRANAFSGGGQGKDLIFYAGPQANYQFTPTLSFQVLYEVSATHTYGAKAFEMVADASDLEPGLSWDIHPNWNFNPYVKLYPTQPRMNSTAIGFVLAGTVF